MAETPEGIPVNSADNQPASAAPTGDAADGKADVSARGHTDFVPTQPDAADSAAPDWWPESADGQCSQSAALFAASQPAPLNVV